MTRLFVYGTLKRGQRNARLMAGGRFLGEASTAPKYALLVLGPYPGLVAGDLAVRGELWQVPADTLAVLDAFEGVPTLFDRRPVTLADGTTAEAYWWRGSANGRRSEVWGERPV